MAAEKGIKVEPGVIATGTTSLTELDSARVLLTSSDRLRIEFNIEDLVKRLLPGSPVAHCGGCNGCMGCSM